jgi:hypothetical protein
MTCHDAREQLSARLDDALSGPERQALGAHLAMCAECRRELDQLRGTVALLGRVPPIHAPAGFVDRMMAEAYPRAWRRRLLDLLFMPLRVKLPLEAAAVLLIGVSALYVYQRTPEVQQVARQETRESTPASAVGPSPPAVLPAPGGAGKQRSFRDETSQAKRTPGEQDAAREEAHPTPPTVGPPGMTAAPAPATRRGDVQEGLAAKPKAMAGPEPPESRASPQMTAKLEKEALVAQRPDAGGAAGPPTATGTLAQSGEPSPSRDVAGAPAAAPPAPAETAAPSAPPLPSREPTGVRSPAAAPPTAPAPTPAVRGRAGGVASAPPTAPAPQGSTGDAPSTAKSRTAARLMRAVDASGRLAVPVREPAEAALDALVGRLGATRVARRLEGAPGMVFIDVVVPNARYRELIEGLGRIGRWVAEHEAPTLPAEVRVEIALTVEP